MLPYVLGTGAAVAVGSYAYLSSLSRRSSWRFNNIPDQSGRIVICTGANSGIGFHFCRHMAQKKAHVIMACRSAEKGNEALAEIKREFPNASIEMRVLDVSSKKSVQDFSKGFMSDFTRLDLLVNNAGVMMQETFLKDGVDNTFATNNFGPYLLTGLLLPMLEKTPGSRIITVSSGVHKMAKRLPWDQLNDPKLNDIAWKRERYRVSKAANISFTQKLSSLLKENGSKVLSIGCHPGYSDTGLQEKVDNAFTRFMFKSVLNKVVAQSAEMGSAPLLMAATDASVTDMDYIGPCGLSEMVGWPTRNVIAGLAKDQDFVNDMWKKAEEWANFKYQF